MAEITSVLFFHVMHYDPKNPRNPAADRFVLSKVNKNSVPIQNKSKIYLYLGTLCTHSLCCMG